ncbi:hypothetical protein [Brucella sp. IR073]|uniref:hypothetical protein n=1 Tax=unclassified Brucella TaxID=2632610 RepID=UPI003B983BB2
MIPVQDIIIPPKTRAPIDQMDQGMDLLRTVLAALQDQSFLDRTILQALTGVVFTAIETLEPVRAALNNAGTPEAQKGGAA